MRKSSQELSSWHSGTTKEASLHDGCAGTQFGAGNIDHSKPTTGLARRVSGILTRSRSKVSRSDDWSGLYQGYKLELNPSNLLGHEHL